MNLIFAISLALTIAFTIRLLWRSVAYRNGTFVTTLSQRDRARESLSKANLISLSSGDVDVFYTSCKKDLSVIAFAVWAAAFAILMAACAWEGLILWLLIASMVCGMVTMTLTGVASAIARFDLTAGKVDPDAMRRITRIGVVLSVIGLVVWGYFSVSNDPNKLSLVLIFPPQTPRGTELVNAALRQVYPSRRPSGPSFMRPKARRFLILDGSTAMTWDIAESWLKQIEAEEGGNLISRTYTKGTGTVSDVSFAYIEFHD